MAKNSQYMNYEGVEAEKQTILAEMNNIIEIIQNAHKKVLTIADEEIWIGKKSDQFFEDLKKLWATGLDGVGYVTTLENDRDNMVKFIDNAMIQTDDTDSKQSINIDTSSSPKADSNKDELVGSTIGTELSVYTENPAKGFVLTTGNQTYKLTDKDKELLYKVVASEAQKDSYDDSLAVMSVILNRADVGCKDPIKIITAKGQFEGYYGGSYRNVTVTNEVKTAVDDALAGVRNNEYMYFVSNGSNAAKYGSNMISDKGNRYRKNY